MTTSRGDALGRILSMLHRPALKHLINICIYSSSICTSVSFITHCSLYSDCIYKAVSYFLARGHFPFKREVWDLIFMTPFSCKHQQKHQEFVIPAKWRSGA